MNSLRVNFTEDKAVWDAFVLTSSQRSIFVHSKFLESLNLKYALVTCYENNKIVAGAPVQIGRVEQITDLVFPYQGVLLQKNEYKNLHSQVENEHRILNFFIKEISDHYQCYCLSNSWRLQDLRAFSWLNFYDKSKSRIKNELHYTGILDLNKFDNFEHYKSSVRSVRRREFNKASSSLEFKFTTDVSLLVSLYKKTFERQNLEVDNKTAELIAALSKQALLAGYGKIAIALIENVPISAAFFVYDDRTAYYLFAANDPEYRKFGSGTYLLMSMIRDAFECNVSEVDFLGVNSPNRGDFKISFNPELKPYHVCTYNE